MEAARKGTIIIIIIDARAFKSNKSYADKY